jgi:hypothetical protein
VLQGVASVEVKRPRFRAALDVRPALRVWCGGECGYFGACRRDELAVGVGLTMQAPTTVRCLGEEHPRPVGNARITGGLGNEPGEFLTTASCLSRDDAH